MSDSNRKLSERYYLTYQRSVLLGLLFILVVGGYFLMKVLDPARDPSGLGGLTIALVYLILLIAVQLATLRGRRWRGRAAEAQAVVQDEWTTKNRGRAFQTGFWVMMAAQYPLMFVMAYLPAQPSVMGMAFMTWTAGLGAYHVSYLYFSRQQSDG